MAGADTQLSAYTVEAIESQGLSAMQGSLGAVHVDGLNTSHIVDMEISAPSGFKVVRHHQHNQLAAWEENPVENTTWVETSGPGSVRTAAYRPYYNLFLAPLAGEDRPSIEVHSKDSWALSPTRNETAQQYAFFTGPDERDIVSADVRGGQQLDGTGDREVIVTGSFVAVFYEWDLFLDSAEVPASMRYVPSGLNFTGPPVEPPSDRVPNLGVLVGSSDYNQTYVYVHNATMRFRLEDPNWVAFYLYGQEVGVEGLLTLKGALPLDDGLDALPQDKGFQGSLRATLDPSGADRIAVRFIPTTRLDASVPQGESPVASIDLDPPFVAEPAGRAVAMEPRAPLLGIGLSVLAVASILLVAGRAAMNHRRFNGLDGLMEAQDYDAVVVRSSPLLPTRRYGSKVAVMHAVALLKTAQPSRASAFLAGLPARRRPPAPTMDYLQACAEILQGHRNEAARLLKDCLVQDPSFASDASLNAWFLPLASHPLLAAWFGGADFGGSYT